MTRRTSRRTIGRAGAAGLVVLLAAGCSAASPVRGTPAPAPSAPSPTAAPADVPVAVDAPGSPRALPVYFVAQTAAGPRLQREFHRITTDDPASEAVREMLAERAGLDPDYRNPWPAGTALRSPVSTADGAITVDLTGVGGGPAEAGAAALAVQQLAFTVQGALQSTAPVRILVDGQRVDRLWGAVPTAEPVPRGDVYALRSPVQIDSPPHGATLGRDVVVTGEAAVFEATLGWEVLRDGAVVRSGTAMTREGQRFAAFEFRVQLEPGEYTVRIVEDDPSGGAGRPPISDDKVITVRA